MVFSKLAGSVNCLATILSPTGTAVQNYTQMNFNLYDGLVLSGDRVTAVPSGGDGAIVCLWAAALSGAASQVDLIAVRYDANGAMVWDPVHRVISQAAKDQTEQAMTIDGADGAIVAWRDNRSPTASPDIYAVRLLANGAVAPGWTTSGTAISNAARAQYTPAIERDGAGGAWIAWTDERDSLAGPDVYFTHILANGSLAPGFAANGRVLCNATGGQTSVQITRDGSGGLFAVWLDARDGETDLYAQHLDANGNPTTGWAAGGNPVCTDGTAQGQPAVAWVSNGRAIVAWKDARTGTDIVYAAALDAVRGVLDVPRAEPGRLALAARANTSRDWVELQLDAAGPGDVTVTLYDVSGRVQSVRVIAGPARSANVRFEGLRPGLYFASAAGGGEHASTRVVLVR
jgi:hypothetical protein